MALFKKHFWMNRFDLLVELAVPAGLWLLLELIDSGGPGEVTHKLIAPRLVDRNTCCSPQERTAV